MCRVSEGHCGSPFMKLPVCLSICQPTSLSPHFSLIPTLPTACHQPTCQGQAHQLSRPVPLSSESASEWIGLSVRMQPGGLLLLLCLCPSACLSSVPLGSYLTGLGTHLFLAGLLHETGHSDDRIVVPQRGRSTRVPVSSVLI